MLAIGPQLYKQVDQAVFTQQIKAEDGVFGWIDEILSTHPNLPRRIHALDEFFNPEQTEVIRTSKKGPILGAGLFLFLTVAGVFAGVWFVKQMPGLASEESYSYYDTASLTDLMQAVVDYDIDAVEAYAADATMLNEVNADGYTALHLAVLENNYEALSHLLTQGADPNTLDKYEYTPLMEAVSRQDLSMVELLLLSGADKELTDSEGYTVHQLALDYGYSEIAEYIETFQ